MSPQQHASEQATTQDTSTSMESSMSTITDLTARPIRFTADIPAWQRILETLGGVLISEHPGWLVYQLGSGRVALHASNPDQPAGRTTLPLETSTPVEQAVRIAAAAGAPIELSEQDHGTAGLVTAADGTTFTLDSPTEAPEDTPAAEPRLSVVGIWYTTTPAEARRVLTSLGARPRLIADDGVWTDLTCDGGGLMATHAADSVGAELAFEWAGNVEEAKALLDAAGIGSALIDETYSRTLQIVDPDGVKEIWINERQSDLYGYTLAEMD
ncbi:hypothetical protein [Ornithinimicrobium panacihumi]|uniref:hypothetical protein n=1 Tax=Ornithinimicrobium panacihumi TaxID=2008449 RepID=UPI003F8980FC